MKRLFSLLISLFIFGLPHWGCPDDNGVKPQPTNPLTLTVEDVTCTEAFLKLSLASSEANRIATLKRNDSTLATITMANSDSLFVDEGLLPNKTYTYTVAFGDWTANAQAITMDTTSHDWMWQIDTLGTSSSVLFDVAIINDTLAYAVGEIHTNETDKFDSLGTWINPYNVARWDGKKWETITLLSTCRLYYPNCGPDTLGYSPGRAVFAFAPNDIWITAGNIFHWDGTAWQRFAGTGPENGNANKIWGTPSSGLWFVGGNGFIAHHTSTGSWQKMESGTTLTLNDVWGGSNKWLGNDVVLIAAGEKYIASETKILKLSEHGLESIPWQNEIRTRQSVWFDEKSRLFSCGSGIYQHQNKQWKHFSDFPAIYTNRIRGNAGNNIMVVGDFGIVGHYNGVNWKVYDELKLPNGNYESVAIKGNLVVAAGWYGQSGRAVVAAGKRK